MAQQPQEPAQEQPETAKTPETTQEQLSQDSGAGIRGGYGNSDQTNGLEGGAASPQENSAPAADSDQQK
ncbi:hypothetical protein ACFPAF_12470 [Hymenobacter endophyticus]|uniref:Uncharacterized protein n=1 Tax=Hymenobacter endophyticus TaxID=3076335 RepID=A0ABU3TIL6_9BACT|nr:hypothetical protein [Hymenobacter endophyticus]MDU0371213.1 hypothetical protein [Hymenobacter endophyticus]